MYSSTRRSQITNTQLSSSLGGSGQNRSTASGYALCTQEEAREIARDIWNEYQ